ncbi:MAG: hypothetical protein ACLRFI_03130 [Alphaproteobacteria bacterium]
MKGYTIAFLLGLVAPVAVFASNEGVPVYYNNSQTASSYNTYQNAGYTKYVGSSGQKQIVGSNSYSYQVPRTNNINNNRSYTTANGIAIPLDSQKPTSIYATYNRRFADFQFETGVQSILEWDDMIFNEFTVGARHNFSVGNFDMSAFAEYTYGQMASGGLSMDYDLKPYDNSVPEDGIFTISMGDESGKSQHLKFGLSAHHIWDIGGWKLSPQIGYEIFKHDLKMSNHYYPNQGMFIPLLTNTGTYVFGDEENFYSVPYDMTDVAAEYGLYQVCMSPEDISLVTGGTSTGIYSLGPTLNMTNYDEVMGDIPWGVGYGDCVIIGGDGPIIIDGTTHIYNTTWSGFYIGLEVEKQVTLNDKLRFYVQFGLPKYSSEGIWPNRDDWQQNPSFLDEGDNEAYSYNAEIEYTYNISDRLQLALKVDTDCFHVGKIPGELYVASYSDWAYNDDGSIATDEYGNPYIETHAAYTEHVSESLKEATWQSFGLHLGVKFAF